MPSNPARACSAWRVAPFVVAGVLAAVPPAASAQSLQSLYTDARAIDAAYLASRALADAATYRAAQIEALARPTASLTANAGVTRTNPPELDDDTSASANATLAGRLPLFNRGNAVTIEQARRSLASAQADLAIAEQDLVLRVAQAYFDVLAAQDALATTRASQSAITEQLASARRNFEVGTATITDTREAQARYDLAEAQAIAADNDLRARRIALETLVGRANVEPSRLATPVTLPTPLPADPDAWARMAGDHPAIRRAQVALEIAELETEKARAAVLPTVDAVASVGNNALRDSRYATNGDTPQATVGVQLTWPLYTGGATQNRIRETLALEERARNDLEAARRGVGQTTRVAYYDVLSGLAQVRALEAAESSSQLALEATQLGYRVGVRVNLDVLNAQTQLYQTQRDLARARYDVLVGHLRLRQAAGQLSPADVLALNALLAAR